MAGHASLRITQEHYRRSTPGDDKRIRAVARKIIETREWHEQWRNSY